MISFRPYAKEDIKLRGYDKIESCKINFESYD